MPRGLRHIANRTARGFVAAIAVAMWPSAALADTAVAAPSNDASAPAKQAPADMSDQAIGAAIGFAAGGRVTPGGLRIAGHYLYQLSDADWFDGVAGFTFGSDSAQCFRDRSNDFTCTQGIADGNSIDVAASVRHFFPATHSGFWPFLRGGLGLAIVRFRADDVTGLAIPIVGGAGLRVSLSSDIALVGSAELQFGFAAFNHGLGLEPQLGATITAGAEFRL